MTRQAGP